jgi:hypothetical protein
LISENNTISVKADTATQRRNGDSLTKRLPSRRFSTYDAGEPLISVARSL